MESLYNTYIMNQPSALEHYHRLSKTFQFDVYFPRSQILAHKSSNAWDLPSLLIKPVQRLLHYPQLIAAIVAETPDSHSDKAHLVEAHARIGEMARGLNERWRQRLRQQKVVQEVLAIAGLADTSLVGGDMARPRKRSGLKISLAASVNIGRIITVRPGTDKARGGPEVDPEAKAIKAWGEGMKEYEAFMATFTKGAGKWADAMRDFVGALEEWSRSFLNVVLTDPGEECPDALELFMALISDLWPLACERLKADIGEGLVRTVNSLKDTMTAPLCLFEEMQRLEPLYYDFLRLSVAKSRPSLSLREAARSYVALRELLSEELPRYFTLLDKGMAVCIVKFANIQQQFYSNVRDLWVELWDGCKVDEETNRGAEETLRVWLDRFSEVQEQLTRLNIIRPQGWEKQTRSRHRTNRPYMVGAHAASNGAVSVSSVFAPLDPLNSSVCEPSPSGFTSDISSASMGMKAKHIRLTRFEERWPSPSRPLSSRRHLVVNTDNDEPNDMDTRITRRPQSDTLLERFPSHLSISPWTPKEPNPIPSTRQRRKSIVRIPQTALYECRVIHPCQPPESVEYRDLPFFTLAVDEVYEILAEDGRPSTHPDLPLYVDDSEDCLMLMRNGAGDVGWGLATFLIPLD